MITPSVFGGLFRVALLGNLQYRAAGSIWMLGMILEPTIYLVVWSTVARSGGGVVGSFDEASMAAYYLTLFLVQHATFSWVLETFQFRIQQGQLAFELLRPVHPLWADLAENVSFKLVMLFLILPAAVALFLGFSPRFEFEAWSLVLFVPALLMGFALRFMIEWSLALSAFWTTRTSAINRAYYSLMLFMAGRAAPIELLPDWMGSLARALPFYSMLGLPVEVFLGRLPMDQVLSALALQALWLVAALAFVTFAWQRAVRRFSAVGG